MCLTPPLNMEPTKSSADGRLSIRRELAGTILITGGLGFLGSVALESLLRNCPQVKRVYLLVRGKRTQTAQQRVEKLLLDGLFHMLHKQVAAGGSNVFLKVQAVEGDLCMPNLGLSDADAAMLRSEVQHVIHCAANIELDADIQRSLSHNYFGTQRLMQLAASCRNLRSFVHVSTYFVNNHMPRNSVVREAVHALPLELGGRRVDYAEFVSTLMDMPSEEANRVALDFMAAHNFNSTYAFGKHLTEMMVVDAPLRPGVCRAMVRPSLIAGLVGDPYPGYVNGFGGPGGYTMGYAVGFFHGPFAVAFGSDYIMDIIPCDIVASVTLAAAAKAASQYGDAAAAARTPIYHACSAHTHTLPLGIVFDCNSRFWPLNPAPLVLPGTKYVTFETEHRATEWGIAAGRWIAWAKILGVCTVMKALGKSREARILRNAFAAFSVYNTPRYDRSILSAADNCIALRAELPAEERRLFTLVADPSAFDWYPYGYTVFAGVRRLLFRQTGECASEVPHAFVYRPPAASLAALGLDEPPSATVNVVPTTRATAGKEGAAAGKQDAVACKDAATCIKDQKAGRLDVSVTARAGGKVAAKVA